MSRKKTLFILFLIFSLLIWVCACRTPYQKRVETLPPPQQEVEDLKEKKVNKETPTEEKTSTEENIAPSVLLEQVIETYKYAQNSWEKGDFETALASLDEAYSILVKVKLPPDDALNEEKESLRLLIAQRIQEIYGSRLVAVGDNNRTIPLVENEHVKEEIKYFQTVERKFFEEGYQRSGLYRPMIVEELKQAGLPEQLSWLPLIESWFKVRAYSRARALGLWQFISSTGYRFYLKQDTWVDDRMDPLKSTRAAIKYLTELHSHFGDWTTALAAYNCGEFRVQKVIREQRINYLDNFWDLYIMLPRETARFVPRFIAALLIINDPEKYGFSPSEPESPKKYETIIFNRPVKLSSLAKELDMEPEELALLNPELRFDATPNYEYSLKVPLGSGNKALMELYSLPHYVPPESEYSYHYVRRGETLSDIARRYRTSITAISRLNQLRRVNLITPGQKLKIPGKKGNATPPPPEPKPLPLPQGEQIIYTVKRGDSLYRIANIFGTTIQRIRELNNLPSNIIDVGQELIIQSAKPKDTVIYKVQAGDTPYNIAARFGMDIKSFLRINGLTLNSKIFPGQELWVILKK